MRVSLRFFNDLHGHSVRILGLALVAAAAPSARAQAAPSSCAELVRRAAAAPEEALRSRQLHTCGPEGATALAALVRRAATRSDSAYLVDLELATSERPLAPVLDAAIEVLGTRSAPLPSRIEALEIGIRQAYGVDSHLAGDFAESPDYCRLLTGAGEQIAGSRARVREAAKSVADNRAEPAALRYAALCVVRSVRHGYALVDDVSQIRVTVRCESMYRVESALDHQTTVRIETANGKRHTNLSVPARGAAMHYTGVAGTTRFYSGDALIAAVPSSSQRCKAVP
jgi:hypothetical protein